MNRDEQEMALWRCKYVASTMVHVASRADEADAAVAEFRKRYPPQPAAPPAVWYDEPPFPKDYATRPCWIAGVGCVFAGGVYWVANEWQVCAIGDHHPQPLDGRRVCPLITPPEPTP